MKSTTRKYDKAPKEVAESMRAEQLVNDMLPPPEELAFRERNERITINLSGSSLAFFRKNASEMNIPYQRMIKQVLDLYSQKYAEG